MSVTQRDTTPNQVTYDYLLGQLRVRYCQETRKDYANISGAEETLAIGTVMGVVDATQKIVPCKSAAVDGSQVPKFILLEAQEAIAIAGTVDGVLVGTEGEYRLDKVVFDGIDTKGTVITTTGGDNFTMEDALRNYGNIRLIAFEDSSIYDN